jgi:hypothetical protein
MEVGDPVREIEVIPAAEPVPVPVPVEEPEEVPAEP